MDGFWVTFVDVEVLVTKKQVRSLYVFLADLLGMRFVACVVMKAEAEVRVAQTEFDRQVEVTRLLLEGISSTHVCLLSLVLSPAVATSATLATFVLCWLSLPIPLLPPTSPPSTALPCFCHVKSFLLTHTHT